MIKKSRFLAFASCLFFLGLCSSAAVSGGARIDLVVDHGVEKEAEAQARAVINAIIDFFHNTYGLALEKDLRIKLTGDKLNYQRSIQDWYGGGEAAAARQSEITGGLQSRGAIILNLGSMRDSQFQLFCLCHEMVHHFQSQESPDKYGAIRWLTEGVANVIAAHILATVGVKRAVYDQNLWLQNLKQARDWPRLESLHTGQEWYAVMQARPQVTYETASLAVMTLVKWRGYGSLFNYFRALKNTGPEDAFYQAFGSRLTDFEKQFRPF
jgi:hypothetical protein